MRNHEDALMNTTTTTQYHLSVWKQN